MNWGGTGNVLGMNWRGTGYVCAICVLCMCYLYCSPVVWTHGLATLGLPHAQPHTATHSNPQPPTILPAASLRSATATHSHPQPPTSLTQPRLPCGVCVSSFLRFVVPPLPRSATHKASHSLPAAALLPPCLPHASLLPTRQRCASFPRSCLPAAFLRSATPALLATHEISPLHPPFAAQSHPILPASSHSLPQSSHRATHLPSHSLLATHGQGRAQAEGSAVALPSPCAPPWPFPPCAAQSNPSPHRATLHALPRPPSGHQRHYVAAVGRLAALTPSLPMRGGYYSPSSRLTICMRLASLKYPTPAQPALHKSSHCLPRP